MSPYRRAVVMVVLAGAFLSTAGVGIRLMEAATGLQVAFYRALGMSVFLTLHLALKNRRGLLGEFRAMGWNGTLAAGFYALASITVIFAILHTTVANVMFIVSLAPFLAAVLARVTLGERVAARTWGAIGVASVGVLIMIEGGLSGDGMLGIGLSFAMAISYAAFTVTLRKGLGGDMLPAACLAGLLLSGVCGVPLAVSGRLGLPLHDLLLCLALGVLQTGLGSLLMVRGSRHVPAAQIAFLAMLEVVLSPIWVWLAVGEQPAKATLMGGVVIALAIAYQAVGGHRR